MACITARRICLSLLWVLGAAFAAEAVAGQRYALVVGIGRYPQESGLAALTADRDASRISGVLRSDSWSVTTMSEGMDAQDRFRPNRANLLHILGVDDAGESVSYEKARSGPLGRGSLSSEDVLLFYYGGHGVRSSDGVDYLVPIDATKNDHAELDPSSLISMAMVRQALRLTGAGKVVMVSDACRTVEGFKGPTVRLRPWGAGSEAEAPDGRAFRLSSPGVEVVELRASGFDQAARETRDGSSGVFTGFLLDAMERRGEADRDGDQCISIGEMFRYAKTQTEIYVRTNHRQVQRPEMYQGDSGWVDSYCMVEAPSRWSDFVLLTDGAADVHGRHECDKMKGESSGTLECDETSDGKLVCTVEGTFRITKGKKKGGLYYSYDPEKFSDQWVLERAKGEVRIASVVNRELRLRLSKKTSSSIVFESEYTMPYVGECRAELRVDG